MKTYLLTAYVSVDVTVSVVAGDVDQAIRLAEAQYPAARYAVQGPGKLENKEISWSSADVSVLFDEEAVHRSLKGVVFMITHWGKVAPLFVPNFACSRNIAKAIRANPESSVSVEDALKEIMHLQLGEGSAFWSWGHVVRVAPAILQQDVVGSAQFLSECALY